MVACVSFYLLFGTTTILIVNEDIATTPNRWTKMRWPLASKGGAIQMLHWSDEHVQKLE